MKFNEDLIFKGEAQQYAPELLKLINIEGKIIKPLPTEYPDIEAKIYKPDIVLELEDKILILEFQSTYVDSADQRRFRHYTSILDINLIKSEKKIELHVLSTIEQEQVKVYKINDYSNFIICIHSLKSYDANEVLNKINDKIKNNEELTRKDLMMLSLVCFMRNTDIKQSILNSAETITKIQCLKDDMAGFIRGVLLIASDKFIDDEKLNKKIIKMVVGKMKSLDKYIEEEIEERMEKRLEERVEERLEERLEERVEERLMENNKKLIINLDNEGLSMETIAKSLSVSLDFVKQTLSK